MAALRSLRAPRSLGWLLALAAGCGDDADTPTTGTGDGPGTTDTPGPTTGSDPAGTDANPTEAPDSDSDSDSDGPGETGDPTGDPVDAELPPILGVPNLDDDDENGKRDWTDAVFADDDDLVRFALPASYTAQLQPGERVALELAGDLDHIRFWHGDSVALGHTGDAPATAYELAAEAAGDELVVVFGDFLRAGTLTVRRLDAGGAELDRREVVVRSAPLLMNHHLQPAEFVQAVEEQNNGSMIATMQQVLGDRFVLIDSWDVWIQDELEWATATAPGQRLNVAMDSIRDRELDEYVKGLRAPDTEPITWGQPGTDTTEDKFGNLEATPPHTAGGVEYPFGRIYYGQDATCGPNPVITEFLARQAVQRPIEVDTCWLCVGHVDEFISFIPDASAPKGFRFLIADVGAAYALLETMDPNTQLPRYAQLHGYGSVGEILEDEALRALNLDVQADHIDPTREKFKAELGLDDADILRLPGLFERINGCSYKQNGVAALIPGMLNLTVANFAGETPHIFVSDPFLRSDTGDQSADPLIDLFREAMPAEFDVHFVDDWWTYHAAIGEVHCGTNVARTPDTEWWTAATHLLGEP